MKNVLMFEDDKRFKLLVGAVNSFSCGVVFNDIKSLNYYDSTGGINFNALSELTSEYLNLGKTFGFMYAYVPVFSNRFEPKFIYLASREDGKELSIVTLAHELGHILDFSKRRDFKDYYNWTPQYKREINAWKEAINFLKEKLIVSKLSLEEFLDDFSYCINTYKENENYLFLTEMEIMKEEVFLMIEDYYKEVVLND